jgi:hypothetical protein
MSFDGGKTVFECLFSDSRGLRELIEGVLKLRRPPKLTVECTRKDLVNVFRSWQPSRKSMPREPRARKVNWLANMQV